jgi:hypothetical protein
VSCTTSTAPASGSIAGPIFADLGVPEVLVTVLTTSGAVTPFPGPQR